MKSAGRDSASGFFYGWLLVGAGFVLHGLVAATVTYSYGVVLAPIAREFGASRLEMMWGITAMLLVSGAVSPFLGAGIDRKSLRALALLGSSLLAGGFALLSVASTIWNVVLIFALFMAPAMILMGPTLVGTMLTRWFSRRRGTAMGVAALGSSTFGLVVPLLLQSAITAVGWRSALLGAGAAILLVAAPAAWIIRDRPQAIGLGPDGDPPLEQYTTPATAHPSATTRGIFVQPNFWLVAIVLGVLISIYSAIMTNLVALARDDGHTAELAALLISAVAGCGIVGKLIFGAVADKIDLRFGLGAAIVLVFASLLLMVADSRYLTLLGASCLLGFAAGGVLPVWGTLMAVLFGVTHYGRVMGLMNPVMMPLVLAGPPFAGWAYDISGSYAPALVTFAIILLFAIAALSRVRMPERERSDRVAAGLRIGR